MDKVDYVAFSGGADSTALAILLHEQGQEFELVFADTGAELPETYHTVTRVARLLSRKLVVVSNGTFYQHLANRGFMVPTAFCRWCTRLLKRVPQDIYYHQKEGAAVAVGIRADEGHRMEGRPGILRPLVDAGLGRQEVLDLCRRHDLLNPAYAWRSNVSCFCCFFQRKGDWRGLLAHHPDLYALAEQWESESKAWADLNRPVGADPLCTFNRRLSLVQLRLATERQITLWPEPEEKACAVCST